MSWKAKLSAVLSAAVMFGASVGLLSEDAADDTNSCIQAALADLDSSEDYHPWRDEGCQAVAEQLVLTIADEFGVEWVGDLLSDEEAVEEEAVEEEAVEEEAVEEEEPASGDVEAADVEE